MSLDEAHATQIYRIFIRAKPEAIWEAITSPGFTVHYYRGARVTVVPDRFLALGPGGDTWADEEVYEYDPPRRLVHRWRSLHIEELAVEPPSRVTWEIEPSDEDVCLLTVTHDRLERSPRMAANVGAGWTRVLSGLKTLLETDTPFFRAVT